jgi:hypothetical protein
MGGMHARLQSGNVKGTEQLEELDKIKNNNKMVCK